MKKLILISLLFGLFYSCATLAPVEVRKKEYIEQIKVDKTTAYKKALAWYTKTANGNIDQIKLRDEESAHIIAKSSILCKAFNQTGDNSDYYLNFTFDFQAKDNKIKVSFEDLIMVDDLNSPLSFSYQQITDQSKVEKAQTCLRPLLDDLIKTINTPESQW